MVPSKDPETKNVRPARRNARYPLGAQAKLGTLIALYSPRRYNKQKVLPLDHGIDVSNTNLQTSMVRLPDSIPSTVHDLYKTE